MYCILVRWSPSNQSTNKAELIATEEASPKPTITESNEPPVDGIAELELPELEVAVEADSTIPDGVLPSVKDVPHFCCKGCCKLEASLGSF